MDKNKILIAFYYFIILIIMSFYIVGYVLQFKDFINENMMSQKDYNAIKIYCIINLIISFLPIIFLLYLFFIKYKENAVYIDSNKFRFYSIMTFIFIIICLIFLFNMIGSILLLQHYYKKIYVYKNKLRMFLSKYSIYFNIINIIAISLLLI
jgi:hypothetical protein